MTLNDPQTLIGERVAIINNPKYFAQYGLVEKVREDAAMVRLESGRFRAFPPSQILFLELGPKHFKIYQ